MLVAIVVAIAFLFCRDLPLGWNPFNLPMPIVKELLNIGSFVVLGLASWWSWQRWTQAKLTCKNSVKVVENVFRAALRESQFDEVERFVRNNKDNLTLLPTEAITVLFSPRVVAALVGSHSLVHLELLADMAFLTSLQNPFDPVDATLRELLHANASPLRAAIVARYGGWEHLPYFPAEQALVEKTIRHPEWYVAANAHYPLLMAGLDRLRTGAWDLQYNAIGADYYASQGISTRARCPIYLGFKTQVLAIDAAIIKRREADFYVTDLGNLFHAILERSAFDRGAWESPLAYREHPTPYAYLLYEIVTDFNDLSSKAVQQATTAAVPRRASVPGTVATALALTWSSCTAEIVRSNGKVSPQFRDAIVRRYLEFVLALGWQPSEIFHAPINDPIEGLLDWRDRYVEQLAQSLRSVARYDAEALRHILGSLDQGKVFIRDGLPWLRDRMGIPDS